MSAAHIESGNIVLKKGESRTLTVGSFQVRITDENIENHAAHSAQGGYDLLIPITPSDGINPVVSPVVWGTQGDNGSFEIRALVTCVGDLVSITYSLFQTAV